MSAKAIREANGKDILNRFLDSVASHSKFVSVDEHTNLADLANQHPWLTQQVCFYFCLPFLCLIIY